MIGILPSLKTIQWSLSKVEKRLLEAKLFTIFYHELSQAFSSKYKYLKPLSTCNLKKEEEMLDADFLRYIINDIISTDEYSLSGIASFTRYPEDALYDLVYGINSNPSFYLSQKIIELHTMVRKDFYKALVEKIKNEISNK